MKIGLYEEVISELLQQQLLKIDPAKFLIEKDKIDEEEVAVLLTKHISTVLQQGLKDLKGKVKEQIAFANNIINTIGNLNPQIDTKDYLISKDAELLLSVLDKAQTGQLLNSKETVRPISPLSQSSLFTGTAKDPSLASELKKEILTSDRVDMLVSFIKWSGIRVLEKELIEFTSRPNSKLRIITTAYMKATDLKAVEFLSSLPNTEIKVSYDTNRTRLHAKAYLFHRDTGFTTAYIGSSNISNPALTDGLEWNLKVTAKDSSHIIQKFEGTFETYWADKEFSIYSETQRETLQTALSTPQLSNGIAFYLDVKPYSYQQGILEQLRAEREVHNRYKNLIVAATGTGKTVISAFDYKAFVQQNPKQKNRLLFVAHRKEILEQSLECFRVILRDRNFGELLVANHTPKSVDHLFISIQSFGSKDFANLTAADFYDYIIVDEFHHAKAPTYQALLEYYKPRILLGLTATPERMDGKDILEYFDGKIGAEIRLYEALNNKLLTPFQYFGISDSVNYENAWINGKYDERKLENLYLNNNLRIDTIVNALNKYVKSTDEVICIGFCATVAHANYMATTFNGIGLKSFALSGNSSEEERSDIKRKLVTREINFVFVVDIYNEGVDIPEIDTILFLRPTESLTVFLQQLGRGLRLSPETNKECLTVLDFIGHAHKSYNFEQKFKALIGRTPNSIDKEIENNFPHLPAGSVIELEKQAKEYVIENIRSALKSNRAHLINKIRNFTHDTGKVLTLSSFIAHHNLTLNDIYSKALWNRLLVEAGLRENFVLEHEEQIAKGYRRIQHINSRTFIQYLQQNMNHQVPNNPALDLMFYYNMWFEDNSSQNLGSISKAKELIFDSDVASQELKELLKINFETINFIDKHIKLPYPCALDLHCLYTRDEVLAAFGFHTFDKKKAQREGVLHLAGIKTDIFFVTLNKSEKEYSPTTLYDDYAISDTLFHWQSQSTTSVTSTTGLRYINQEPSKNTVLLFVRESNKKNGIGAPYHFLGKVNYLRHEGSKPISITWQLEEPMPVDIWKESGKLAI